MRINPRVITSAAAIAFSFAVAAAAYFYRSRNEINEVMVFCKLQFNAYGCFDKLMSYVEAAKKSVSVCMPGIQNAAIQGRLVKLMKKKNIKVQIIIDRSGNDSTDFLLKELIEVGAEIKYHNNNNNILYHTMQHKFCLVDNKVLMTGTLNWGNDLSSDHWNYVYITSKNQLVKPVKNQFNQMWNQYSTLGHDTHRHNESDSEHNESHSVYIESDHEHNENSAAEVLNSVADVLKCNQEPLTFRETVTTPEVTITT